MARIMIVTEIRWQLVSVTIDDIEQFNMTINFPIQEPT